MSISHSLTSIVTITSLLTIFAGISYLLHNYFRSTKAPWPKKLLTEFDRIASIYDAKTCYALAKRDRENQTPDLAYTYGEIPIPTLIDVLNLVKLSAKDTFYDLGSGDGRAVVATALIFPLHKACGIEQLPALHQHAVKQLALIRHSVDLPEHFDANKIAFIEGDFYQVPFDDADVLYVNATGLFGDSWALLVDKFQQMKINSRIITTSREINHQDFKLIDARWRALSWGPNRVFIYQKIK